MKNAIFTVIPYDQTDAIIDKLQDARQWYRSKFYEYNTKTERTVLLKYYRTAIDKLIKTLAHKVACYVFKNRVSFKNIESFITFIESNIKQAYKENRIKDAIFLSEYRDFLDSYIYLYEENKRKK